MAPSKEWVYPLPPSSHQGLESHNPIIRVLMTNYNSVSSPELEPLPRVEVNFGSSNPSIHEIQIKFPEILRQAVVTSIISAFQKLNKLVVYVDSYKFEIVFSPKEVDVAATSALINKDWELLILTNYANLTVSLPGPAIAYIRPLPVHDRSIAPPSSPYARHIPTFVMLIQLSAARLQIEHQCLRPRILPPGPPQLTPASLKVPGL
ncbi:hypothetical protein EDB84DRAFT_1565517 [Lactarius hengduanensis]|nr:hypothetical protein EDB84DRAFT_1565517 [Lactarius hengduanensis]